MIASWKAVRHGSPENEDSYGLHLPSIFKAINELRMAIGENFSSGDLVIMAVECY